MFEFANRCQVCTGPLVFLRELMFERLSLNFGCAGFCCLMLRASMCFCVPLCGSVWFCLALRVSVCFFVPLCASVCFCVPLRAFVCLC